MNKRENILSKFFLLILVRFLVVQDGTIDKNDLRGAFDNVGVLMTESELDELLGEVQEYITPLNLRFLSLF